MLTELHYVKVIIHYISWIALCYANRIVLN